MARSRQNTSSQQSNQVTPAQNWWDRLLVHIGSTGGAFIVLITIGGAFFEAGRRYMENEKNIEIFDLKTEIAGDFHEALDELNTRLGTSYSENQVRIKSAVRLN